MAKSWRKSARGVNFTPSKITSLQNDNIISNVYTYKLVNKTTAEIKDVRFELMSHKGKIELVTHKNFNVPKQGIAEGTLFIEINGAALNGDSDRLKIGVYSNDKLIETTITAFLGPRSYR